MKVVFFILLTIVLCADHIDLTDETFESFIQANQAVMVEFYSPQCANCQKLEPFFADFAKTVAEKHLPYLVAKVNVLKEKQTADKYSVGKLPILKFFIGGKYGEYYGETNSGYMIKFVEQLYKSVHPYIEITSEDELKKRAEVKSLSVILVGGSKEDLDIFATIPKNFESIWFFHVSKEIGQKVFSEIKKDRYIVLIKEFDEEKSIYEGNIEEKAIESFIEVYTKPKVSGFNQEIIGSLFKPTGKKGVILLREDNEEGKKAESIFITLAEKHRSKDFLFVVSDIDSELGKRVAKMMSLTKTDLPHMEIVETKKKLERSKFEGTFTFETMNKFVDDWKTANSPKTDL